MKCALIFPPTADPTQPYSSLPCLAAYLQDRGRHSAILIDANIAFFRAALTQTNLVDARDRVRERMVRLEQQNHLNAEDATWYARAMQSTLKSPFVIDGIPQALTEISSVETFSAIERLNDCKRKIQEAAELLSCAWSPVSFRLGGASDLHFGTPADVGIMVEDVDNPYTDFLKAETLPAIGNVSAVGISITYRDQILPAFTLASLVRRYYPGLPVIFGGNLPSIWYHTVDDCPDLFDWCDYLVAFEGETALDNLLTAFEAGNPLDRVPNLVYRQNDAVIQTFFHSEQLNQLPTPDYDQLPLDSYFSPEPALFVYATRGCYWSRCEFCAVSPSMRGKFRIRDPELVHRDISVLHEKYHTPYIAFSDDCAPSQTLLSLSQILIDKGPKVTWQCEVRFESALDEKLLTRFKAAGCVNLIFGLESFSARVLKKMKKGISPEKIRRVLEDCRRVGIAFNLQLFFGFPGETETEAETTKQFIEEQAHGPATFSFGTYELHRNSGIHRNPDQHNITIKDTQNPLSIVLDYGPKSEHAPLVKSDLHETLRSLIPFPYAGLSLNAHTLIFLSVAGVNALSDLYRPMTRHKPQWEDRLLDASLTLHPEQHIESFKYSTETLLDQKNNWRDHDEQAGKVTILYDYNSDNSVEVSDLTISVIAQISNGMTLNRIIAEFGKELDDKESKSRLRYILTNLVRTLYEKGFIVADGDGCGAACP